MAFQIRIEIQLSEKDDALLNEAYDYLGSTKQSCDLDAATPATHFMQSIYKMIAIRQGLKPMTINGFHGELHDDFLELRSGKITEKQAISYDLRDFI